MILTVGAVRSTCKFKTTLECCISTIRMDATTNDLRLEATVRLWLQELLNGKMKAPEECCT